MTCDDVKDPAKRRAFIIATLSDQLGVPRDEITDDAHLDIELACDSLDIIELVMSMEEEFQITIDDPVCEGMHTGTVKHFIDTIEQQIVEQKATTNG